MKYALAFLSLFALFLIPANHQSVRAQSPGLAGLVIDYGAGENDAYCLWLDEKVSSGLDFLSHSDLAILADYTSQGAAVCKIGNTGCPADDCFCDSPPNYWSYWHLENGQWVYASAGALSYTIEPGQVDGWAWGNGAPPPPVAFSQICPASLAMDEASTKSQPAQKPTQSAEPANPIHYVLFGILATALGIGLIWLAIRR